MNLVDLPHSDFKSELRLLLIDLMDVSDRHGLDRESWASELIDDPLTLPRGFRGLTEADTLHARFDTLAGLAKSEFTFVENPSDEARQVVYEALHPDDSAGLNTLGADPVSRPSARPSRSPSRSASHSGSRAIFPPSERTGMDSIAPGMEGPASPPPPPSPDPQSAEPPEPPEPPQNVEPPERRFIEAGIMGHDGNSPLKLATDYILEFGVVLEKARNSIAAAALPDASFLFKDDEDTIELTVQVNSSDFSVAQKSLPLTLPRRGPSPGKARFDIRAIHEGPGSIVATFHKHGNFIEQIELTLMVGGTTVQPHESTSNGRNIDNASVLEPRDIGIRVGPATERGYDVVVWGAVSTQVTLPITRDYLNQAIINARAKLMAVVMQKGADRTLSFQKDVQIDKAEADTAMEILREAGGTLFRKLFFSNDAGKDVRRVGEFLREQATNKNSKLTIQIISKNFPLPWPLLYVGEENAPTDWECFLGMRHIIEQIPLQPDLNIPDDKIASNSPSLSVSVNVNAGIDAQMGSNFVARQLDYWKAASASLGLRVVERQQRDELLTAMNGTSDDQIMYLYCHADTTGIGDVDGIDSSCFILTGDQKLTLGDLSSKASISTQLAGKPLVIVNACESAQLSPMFYDGFVPYFMAKGARGVIGTECKTPALFATEWALQFFPMLLSGTTVGEAMLATRRYAWTQWNNPLGLLYAVYCATDTRITPGLDVH